MALYCLFWLFLVLINIKNHLQQNKKKTPKVGIFKEYQMNDSLFYFHILSISQNVFTAEISNKKVSAINNDDKDRSHNNRRQ